MHGCDSCEAEVRQVSPYGLCEECQAAFDQETLESPVYQELVQALLEDSHEVS